MQDTNQSTVPNAPPELHHFFYKKEELLNNKQILSDKLKSVKRKLTAFYIVAFVCGIPAWVIASLISMIIASSTNSGDSADLVSMVITVILVAIFLSPLLIIIFVFSRQKSNIINQLRTLKAEFQRLGLEFKEEYSKYSMNNVDSDPNFAWGTPVYDPIEKDWDDNDGGWDSGDDGGDIGDSDFGGFGGDGGDGDD